MKNLSDIRRSQMTKRLSKLPPKSGHAKVLRAKLGISPVVDVPAPAPAPAPVATPTPVFRKKGKRAKKKN